MTNETNKSKSFVEVTVPDNFSKVITPVAIVISAIMVSVSVIYVGSNSTAKTETVESTLGETDQNNEEPVENNDPAGKIIGQFETFTEYDAEICQEDGKPEVYLFITTWCGHCTWIKETFSAWAKDNSDKVTAYLWEVDTNDNSITDTVETEIPEEHYSIYEKFNPRGSIPTFVFGCRYSRIGNGYESQNDLGKEVETFNHLLEKIL